MAKAAKKNQTSNGGSSSRKGKNGNGERGNGKAAALGISVHTLRNWEQDRRHPEGPALALLRIAARHPRVLKENLTGAAPRSDG